MVLRYLLLLKRRKTYKTKYLDTISYRKFAIIENKNSMQVEIFSLIDVSLIEIITLHFEKRVNNVQLF